MITSILFLISACAFWLSLLLMPKNKERLNAIVWLFTTFMGMLFLWIFYAGIMSLFYIKVCISSLAVCNAAGLVLVCAYCIFKKETQKYYVCLTDIVVFLGIAGLSAAFGVIRFGRHIDLFAYASDDSVRHFAWAKELALTGKITQAKYGLHLLDMIFMQVLEPLTGQDAWYRVYMLVDIFLLMLLSMCFWILIRRYAKGKFKVISAITFTAFYMCGYPLLNMLHGFEYLGMGVLCVNFILFIIQLNDYEEIPVWMRNILLCVTMTALSVSYTQFIPAVMVGILVYYFIYYMRRWSVFSIKMLATLLSGFAVPGILCVCHIAPRFMDKLAPLIIIFAIAIAVLVFIWVIVAFITAWITHRKFKECVCDNIRFVKNNRTFRVVAAAIIIIGVLYLGYRYIFLGMIVRFTSVEGGMALDGSIYREPYSNFIILLIPLVLHIIKCAKHKENDATLWIIAGSLIFAGWLLWEIQEGKIGSYYFYKMHFMVWFLIFYEGYRYLAESTGRIRKYMAGYLALVFALFVCFIIMRTGDIGTDTFLYQASDKLFSIYDENLNMYESGGNVTVEKQQMYNEVRKIVNEKGVFVPYFGRELRYLKEYYYYLTNQNPEEHPEEINSKDYPSYNIREDLDERGIKYLFLEKGPLGTYDEYWKDFQYFYICYENDYGYLLKVE